MIWIKNITEFFKTWSKGVTAPDGIRDDLKSCMRDCAKLDYRLIELETKVENLEQFVKYMQP